MLSVKHLGSGKAGYYLSLTATSYYVEGPEPDGLWYGLGAEAFGLAGKVEARDLEMMCEGFDPSDPSRHVRNAGINEGPRARKHGDDLCFSAPKSVSVAWSLASPELRDAIEKKMERAVKDALDYIQAECGYARVGAQGQELARTPLAFAIFSHCSSRAGDPNLHFHCVCPNLVLHENANGKLRVTALDSTNFYHHKMTAGALFRASLAAGLQEIGFEVERDRFAFRLKGFSDSVCEKFSQRRAEIVEAILSAAKVVGNLSELDSREVLTAAAGKMAELVTLSTRKGKKEYTRSQMFPVWRDIARGLGVERGYVESLIQEPRKLSIGRRGELMEKLFSEGMDRMNEEYSHFAKKDITRMLAEEAQCTGLSARNVREVVEGKLRTQDILHLGEVAVDRMNPKRNVYRVRTEVRYTTEEMLKREGLLLGSLERLKHGSRAIDSRTVEHVISSNKRLTSDKGKEQADAVRLLTTGAGRIACMTGKAGTGKSTTLNACRLAWELEGRKVIGCALAGDAADELQRSAGIESHSLARTLSWLKNGLITLTDKHVVVLDEAGMVSTKKMQKLFAFVEQSGAKIVLAGDAKQLQAIGAGGPFWSITERLGEEFHCTLTRIFRQSEEWRRETVRQFSDGDAGAALNAYLKMKQLVVTTTREEALASLVEHWKNDRGIQEPRNVLLLASLNAEVREVNRMCQRERFVAGVLGTEKLFVDGDHLHVGDRVRLGLGKDALRHGIKNGFTGEVVSVNPETRMLSIRLDKGDRLVTLSVEHFGAQHIRLGYARTVHGSQGKTVRACHVLMGGHMDDLHLGYVQSSRSTDSTSLIVDQAHAGPQLKDIVRSLSRDRTKDLARDILDRTHELSQERTQKPRQQHHHGHSHRL